LYLFSERNPKHPRQTLQILLTIHTELWYRSCMYN